MKKYRIKNTGTFIAYILRHNPSAAQIELDEHGFADIDALIDGVCKTGRALDRQGLENIVKTDGKHRFDFNDDRTKIRANQGHSLDVDVEMDVCTPPDILYHGTAEKYLESIQKDGILKKTRKFVHLSPDEETAIEVGARHGKAVVIKIDARRMYEDGFIFLLSKNGVWQVEHVPCLYFLEIIKPPV